MSRIETLIAKMTLAEKLGQLTMTAAGYAVTGPVIAADATEAIKAGTIGNLLNLYGAEPVRAMQRLAVEESRLGIPLLIAHDIIHGHRTLFPVPLAEAGLFDPTTWELTAREAAKEAAADGLAMTFAPMLDVARDPRWGRGVEGPGEDPWLGECIAAAKVAGFQGTDLAAADSLAAVAKHFCGYGAVTAGREYASVDISERTLREVHLPPFAAAVSSGVAGVMPAFNDLAGIPLTAHGALLRDVLRGRLGFDGVIVSDYNAIGELIQHGIAADLSEAAALALHAGVDIDMMADAYRRGLPDALARGHVSLAQIDAAVRRVLALKQRLGLFDDPYRRGAVRESPAACEARRGLAREVAGRAIVLLKNEADALPLVGTPRLAVIGPLADASAEMRGPWAAGATAEDQVSVLAGLRAAWPPDAIVCARGVALEGGGTEAIAEALEACAQAQAIVLCLGEGAAMSGEAHSRAHLGLPGHQGALATAVLERAHSLGKRVVVVLFSGRPLVVPWLIDQADAVLAAWFLGAEAGNAVADILSGRRSPSGRTAITWPRALGQVPVFFAQRPTGRPASVPGPFVSGYIDVPTEPQFAFGHGLSYGKCTLSNLRVTPQSITESDSFEVCVEVTNEGAFEAEETVFVFTHDKLASVARPLLELKGFGKIVLRPGEHGTIRLTLAAVALRFLGRSLEPVFEAGEVEVLVGTCADRARLLTCTLQLV
jgi:beta-glucosidase